MRFCNFSLFPCLDGEEFFAVTILRGALEGHGSPRFLLGPPFAPPSFFGKEFASERVKAACIARKIFVIYNH